MKIHGLVTFSVEKRVSILMLGLIIVVFGFLSLTKLGLDMLPDITFPTVTIVTQYPGVAPEEIEQLVTIPLEGILARVNKVKKLQSQSLESYSIIKVEFAWGTNLDYGAQDLKDNIDLVKDFLPQEMKQPIVFKFDISQIPIMFIGVTGLSNTYELRHFLQDNVVERLQRLDGVAQAAVFGGQEREIRVSLDLAKLKYYNLSINEIKQSLALQNSNMPAGHHVTEQTDFLIRSLGELTSFEDIENAIVGISANRVPIRLRDIATIKDTYREQRSKSLMNSKESVFLYINKRSGSNTLKVAHHLKKELKAIYKQYPQLTFLTIFDQGKPVQQVIKSTTINALLGGFFAVLFMFLFLMNIRPTLIIFAAIPLSIIATFIAVHLAGFTLNLMTLGGLALGIGMLVDNAIVVIENIYRYLEKGHSGSDAAKQGCSEIATAISASTFTTIVVFLPILFSEGLAGELTRGLSLTIMFALLASLMVALTIVPMLASVFLKVSPEKQSQQWFLPIREWYGKKLIWVLDHAKRISSFIFILVFASIVIFMGWVGKEFMPAGDSTMFLVNIALPIGTPLEESSRICQQISDLIQEYPEVEAVGQMIGRDETDRGDQAATGPHVGQLFIRLVEVEKRSRSAQEIQNHIRSRLPQLRDTKIRFTGIGGISGEQKPVKVNVYGKNLQTLAEITNTIVAVMQSIPELKDIETSFSQARPEYHFVVDRQKAFLNGLTPIQIQAALETANLGKIATQFRTGEDEINVRIILDKKYRDKLEWLRSIPIKTMTGKTISLNQVISIKKERGPTIINRDQKYRVGTVDANISGKALGSLVSDLKKKMAAITGALPNGYNLVVKGQFENMQETFAQLLLGLAIAVLLVYMVMAAQFESLVHPLGIMFTFPLAFLGVVWILLLFGKTFSTVNFIGLIILAGITVNNGIVLIDYTNKLRAQGWSVHEAIVEAGKTRIRPILITAGTTIVGMLPMALSNSQGSELRSPMALTVIGGLISATLLTLFAIPIVYISIDKIGTKIKEKVKKVI